MFWDAVVGGLGVLAYWETYVAGLESFALLTVPTVVFGFMAQKSGKAAGTINYLSMLALPVFQVFAIVVLVLTLSPIILGLSHDAAWTFPWILASESPGALAKFVGVLLVAALGMAFLPILGRFPPFHSLVLGALALALVIAIIENTYPGAVSKRVHFWPGFWFAVGLLVVGGVMAWLGVLVAALLAMAVDAIAGDTAAKGLGQLLMFPVAATFGFIPVFIYGAWLGAQLRSAG